MPKYEALAALLRQQIRSGRPRPGDRLSSLAQPREQFNVVWVSQRAIRFYYLSFPPILWGTDLTG
jgi:DNA-binding FadR family transcriptional regulator